MRRPELRPAFNIGQWIVGLQFDYGRIVPVRWIVIHLGPFSLAISAGRKH
jgi:hypothetical protein